MLHLYHWEPNGASARVLIALEEKGLAFESRYVDLLAFEQHRPDFLRLNGNGQVPVLLCDEGTALTGSSYICEYLEEAFLAPPLMPPAPPDRWRVRWWQKYVDDNLAQAVSELAWTAFRPQDPIQAPVSPPTRERRQAWEEAVAGYPPERLDQARERVALALADVETSLAGGPWLVGDGFSLADIAVFAYAAYLPRLLPDLPDRFPRPRVWLERTGNRRAVRSALARGEGGDPFATAAPGPERVRWG